MDIENANRRFKKGVVAIWVNDERVGTGFCVQENIVLTCAHVIDKEATSPPRSKLIMVRTATNGAESVAEIVAWRGADDVALLRCDFNPAEVTVVRLGEIGNNQPARCHAFGYPNVDDIDGLIAEAEFRGIVDTESGRPVIQLDSKELTRGFSGAPLVERETGRAIGMVSSIVGGKVEHLAGRLENTAFAIPASEIGNIFPDLTVEPATLEKDHQKAIDKLKEGAIADLKKSSRATCRLSEIIKDRLDHALPYKVDEEELPRAVADALFNSPLNDVLDIVMKSYHELANDMDDADDLALNAIVNFGSHLFPAIYDESQLRDIRASIKDRSFLVLPATTKTIVEVLMAGVDGRKAMFAAPFSSDNLPGGEYEIQDPPEDGMTDANFQTQFEDALFDVLGIPAQFRSASKINAATEDCLKDKNQRFYYIFTLSAEPRIDGHRERVVEKLKRKYPDVVFFKQCKPADDMREFKLLFRLQDMFKRPPSGVN